MGKVVQWIMGIGVVGALAFAGWAWLRPYDGAVGQEGVWVVASALKQDGKYYWLEVELQVAKGHEYDWLEKPELVMVGGSRIGLADTRVVVGDDRHVETLWFKFWLEDWQLQQVRSLCVDGKTLRVRQGKLLPVLASGEERRFTTWKW